MKLSIKAGATSQSVLVFVQNNSVTTGVGLTGLVFNTSGLTAYYSFAGAAATSTAITLATLASVTSAWSSGGFKEIDSTNMPGVYRLDIPNAALASRSLSAVHAVGGCAIVRGVAFRDFDYCLCRLGSIPGAAVLRVACANDGRSCTTSGAPIYLRNSSPACDGSDRDCVERHELGLFPISSRHVRV